MVNGERKRGVRVLAAASRLTIRLGRACEKERTRGSAVFQAEHDSTQRTGTARTRLFDYSLTTWE